MIDNQDKLGKLIKDAPLEKTSEAFTDNLMNRISSSKMSYFTNSIKPFSNKAGFAIVSILILLNFILVLFLLNSTEVKYFSNILKPANNLLTSFNFPFIGLVSVAVFLLVLLDTFLRNKYFNNQISKVSNRKVK